MSYKHIIWDWNGTLLDDRWLTVEAMNQVLSRRKMPLLTEDQYLEVFTFPVIEYYRQIGFDFDQEPFTVSGTEFIEEYTLRMQEPVLHDGARAFMKHVERKGLTQSLLSAASQSMLETLMDYHGLRTYFLKLVGQDNHYAHGKEAAGKAWMEELHYGPHEVLLIGDTIHDREVAQSIGADCVLLSRGHTSHERLMNTGGMVFKDFEELTVWFDSNERGY